MLPRWWVARFALRAFIADGGGGAIVNVSSIHALAGFPDSAVYDATKAAIEAVDAAVCVEYGHLGIRCNSVAPGAVDTAANRQILAVADEPALTPPPMGGTRGRRSDALSGRDRRTDRILALAGGFRNQWSAPRRRQRGQRPLLRLPIGGPHGGIMSTQQIETSAAPAPARAFSQGVPRR